ncbi:MAG: hypothetical protein ACP59X_13695 [Solidesulfovibrio sp. DCME]|uniref:hypothetical protein n=1 Tax=Solidesulfovibrio sp. DCME TaxID=3447380 RepID=UPI003D0F3F48
MKTFLQTAMVLGLCAVIAPVAGGCAKHQPPAPQQPAPVASAAPAAPAPAAPAVASPACDPRRDTLYDQGVCAYDAGEVKRAIGLWRTAANSDPDPAVRRKALFALAAAKLGLAGNDADLTAALEMLDAWAKSSPDGGSGEEARFLLPAVKALKPAWGFKEQKAALERECAKKLAEREEQVRKSLQQQVRALETIHQQIQEKKKGLINN